ncbi:MAG: hypothetical protein OXC37_01785 [Bdellovibrionaceae bacterium]|nr:hypothetical protein [Pseudobdellovibrionaceae bacterium]
MIKENFDSLVFADWPKGLYLAQKLALKKQKVAYVECLPRLKNPFGIFLNENDKSLKLFLENLGFLSQQEGGFCLISPEGVWPLQERKIIANRIPTIKNLSHPLQNKASFKTYWLSYLSLNMSSKIFKDNDSVLKNKRVNLLDDYFLFEASPKKIEEFKTKFNYISFFSAPSKSILFKKNKASLELENKTLNADKIYCFSSPDRISEDLKLKNKNHWQWQAFYLKADFSKYTQIIPTHFVFLKNIYWPWCYDNLLSIFHRQGLLEVWMKINSTEKLSRFKEQAKKHLNDFFKGCQLKTINKDFKKSFKVYSEEFLNFSIT